MDMQLVDISPIDKEIMTEKEVDAPSTNDKLNRWPDM